MAEQRKRLPVGIDSFETLIHQGCYYLDKTDFVRQLVDWHGAVNLFTRPRRFGKTLIMTMLKAFFEIGTDAALFDGLSVSQDTGLCENWQGKYPVIFLSLKNVEGIAFENAVGMLSMLISNECRRLSYLLKSELVEQSDKDIMRNLLDRRGDEVELKSSLSTLMRMLHAHYGKQVILLIDEYDVPLDKANTNGYYGQMIDFLRGFFGTAFKTNPDLCFAVLTGCLRISKESIFTGLNNLKVDTISDERYDEYFGFTDKDVQKILTDYGLFDAYESMKEWYDGYCFGNADVYCPWDVICHCDRLLENPNRDPQAYWDNTSSNELVKRFIELADTMTRRELEELIAGGCVEKKIVENLTYGELEEDKDHLWSVLYLTGYLTVDKNLAESGENRVQGSDTGNGTLRLRIPNREVREIFIGKIQKWFDDEVKGRTQTELYEELWNCREQSLEQRIRDILYDTISYYDYHENYYHALMAGLLLNGAYHVKSNAEMGLGRSDIVVEDDRRRRAVIIETKRSDDYDDLEKDCEAALGKIEEKRYGWPYLKKKYQVIAYGISFAEKECRVRGKRLVP